MQRNRKLFNACNIVSLHMCLEEWCASGLMVSALYTGLWIERFGFEPWLETLCGILGQDTLFSQYKRL